MASCCTPACEKGFIFGCGSAFVAAALILGLLWPTVYLNILHSQLALTPGSKSYDMWKETPIPMYLELYLFNWTNPEQVNDHSVKPSLVEMGPYVFQEHHKRVNVTWNSNFTVTFQQVRTWQYVPDMSKGSLDDKITNLNVIASTVAYIVRDKNPLIQLGVEAVLNEYGEQLTVTKTAREMLFDGYDDPILNLFHKLNNTAFNIPFDKFGWFYDRNSSATYDGTFTMHTGEQDLSQLGVMDRWNGLNQTNFYRDECGMVNGTTGEVLPPIKNFNDISVFATDICRPVSLAYSSPVSRFGVDGNKYVGDASVFDNGTLHPDKECFCTSDPEHCPDLPSGMLNVSSCRFGAPAFVSYPHFYLSDPVYLDSVEGLSPDKSKHEFFVALEPSTGIPLQVRAQLQINILLQPIKGLKMFKNVPKVFMPMLWFRQHAELTEDLASTTKVALLLADLGTWIAIGMAVFGALLLIAGGVLCLRGRWKNGENERLLS